MASYKSNSAPAEAAEVTGEVVSAFIDGFPAALREVGKAILEQYGIKDPGPGAFFPLQSFLDAMGNVAKGMGDQMLFHIEQAEIATHAQIPHTINSLEDCMASIDKAYHMNHRGGEIGNYRFLDEGNHGGLRKARMMCRNPYPHAFDRGLLEGFAKRFKPQDCIDVVVRDDDTAPNRKAGADSSEYVITWG